MYLCIMSNGVRRCWSESEVADFTVPFVYPGRPAVSGATWHCEVLSSIIQTYNTSIGAWQHRSTRLQERQAKTRISLCSRVKRRLGDFAGCTCEPPHDKTNKMTVRPGKTQIGLGIRPVWPESLLCAQRVAMDPSFLHADSEDWSDRADAQADLSLRWAHMPFCWFCHEAAQQCGFVGIAVLRFNYGR